MALSGSLSAITASDGTFSVAGAAAYLTIANRTVTLSGIATAAQGGTNSAFFQVAGPTVARTYTFPDADATIARTDAANTFTGVQTFNTPIATASVATMSATVGGGVPTPPNNTTTFLRGDGTFAAPAGGGATLNGITAATGAVTIANANNTGIVWNWAPTTDSTTAMKWGETSAATNGTITSGFANQVLTSFETLAASTATPFQIKIRGVVAMQAGSTLTQMVFAPGSANSPIIVPAGGAGTGSGAYGLFFATSSVLPAISVRGTKTVEFGDSAGIFDIQALSTIAGTVADPAFGPQASTSSGLYFPTSTSIAYSNAGQQNWTSSAGLFQFSKGTADAVSYALNFRKSRGSVGTPTVITTGDDLATMTGYGYVGATNTYLPAAQILFDSTGTIADATSGIGGQVKISTTLAGTDTALQLGYTFQGGSNPITIRAAILFANLGTPANGAEAYCSDCDAPTLFNSTCTSAGAKTGAFAQRINGAWIC